MITACNLNHWLIEQALKQPDKLAVTSYEKTLTYSELFEECKELSIYLCKKGIRKNDHVGILFGHHYRFLVIVNSLWLLGAVPVPLNTRNTVEEIQTSLNSTDINHLIIDDHLRQQFSQITIQNKIHFSPEAIVEELKNNDESLALSQLEVNSQLSIFNSALIMFTSGSRGRAKAVVHTFKSLFESVNATDSIVKLTPDDIWLASLPLYHIGGFMIFIRAILSGSSVTFPKSLKHDELGKTLDEASPSHVSFVSTTLDRLVKEKVKPPNKLRSVFLGGGPLEDKLIMDAVGEGWPIIKVYGSTETCSMVTALRYDDVNKKTASAGRPMSTSKIKILSRDKNNSDRMCDNGEVGEIVVSSPSLFKEYFNDKTATDEVIKNGLFYTGDYGWMDEDGYLFVSSRREDLIITGGENVSSLEVENAIRTISIIDDVFVFPVNDEEWGQIVCAAIVSKEISEIEIRDFLKEKIAGYKIPKKIFFVEKIPKNEMGKVKREHLLKQLNLN